MYTASNTINTSNAQAPVPLLRTMRAMSELDSGEVLLVISTEPKSKHNLRAFCYATGNDLLESIH